MHPMSLMMSFINDNLFACNAGLKMDGEKKLTIFCFYIFFISLLKIITLLYFNAINKMTIGQTDFSKQVMVEDCESSTFFLSS